jgi:signal transduction histidine kinase/CheY-like chemotaxis protein
MWQLNPYAPFVALAACLSLAIGAWVRARGRSPVTQALLFLIACLIVDAVGLVWDLSAATMPLKRVGVFLQYVGFSFLPFGGLNFALTWSGRDWFRGPVRWLVAAPGALLVLGWLTNDFHHAVEVSNELSARDGFVMRATTAGWGFWAFILYGYICVLIAAVIYFLGLISGSALSKSQARLLLGGTFIPWLANFVFISGYAPDPALDVSVFGHVGMVASWAIALVRGQMLELIPAARNLVFEKLGDPVLVLDGSGRVLDSNEAFRSLVKVKDDITGRSLQSLGLGALEGTEWLHGGRTYAVGHSRVTLHRGAAAGEVLSLRDVTERVAAELEASRLARARADFLARMSHEVRTPLYGVLGSTELALEHELPDDVRGLLEAVQRSGNALVEIVDEVLDFSSVDAGRMQAELRAVDLSALVDDLKTVFEGSARVRGNSLAVDRAPGPYVVRTDASRLRQVMSNLVSNAIKFTEKGAVTIALKVTPREGLQRAIELSVRDTGIGIPAEVHEQIFEPFAQADASISRRYGGSGLGLAIARRMVLLIGGQMRLSSTPGHGSVFTVELLADATEAPEAAAESSRAKSREGQVMVVDDHQVSRQLSRALLEREGCHVHTVSSGEEAIADAVEHRYALILLDVRMPDLEGPEVLTRLRAAGVETPVVWLTADAVDVERLAGRAQGILRKPFRTEELREVLDRFVVRSLPVPSRADDGVAEAFSETSGRELEAVARALEVREHEQVRSLLHGLQGSAALIGAHELAELCTLPVEEIEAALPRLHEARARALGRLRKPEGTS